MIPKVPKVEKDEDDLENVSSEEAQEMIKQKKRQLRDGYKKANPLSIPMKELQQMIGSTTPNSINFNGIFSFQAPGNLQDVSEKYKCPSSRKLFQFQQVFFSIEVLNLGDTEFPQEPLEFFLDHLFFKIFPSDSVTKVTSTTSNKEKYQTEYVVFNTFIYLSRAGDGVDVITFACGSEAEDGSNRCTILGYRVCFFGHDNQIFFYARIPNEEKEEETSRVSDEVMTLLSYCVFSIQVPDLKLLKPKEGYLRPDEDFDEIVGDVEICGDAAFVLSSNSSEENEEDYGRGRREEEELVPPTLENFKDTIDQFFEAIDQVFDIVKSH